jgi:hypothetical protein
VNFITEGEKNEKPERRFLRPPASYENKAGGKPRFASNGHDHRLAVRTKDGEALVGLHRHPVAVHLLAVYVEHVLDAIVAEVHEALDAAEGGPTIRQRPTRCSSASHKSMDPRPGPGRVSPVFNAIYQQKTCHALRGQQYFIKVIDISYLEVAIIRSNGAGHRLTGSFWSCLSRNKVFLAL